MLGSSTSSLVLAWESGLPLQAWGAGDGPHTNSIQGPDGDVVVNLQWQLTRLQLKCKALVHADECDFGLLHDRFKRPERSCLKRAVLCSKER